MAARSAMALLCALLAACASAPPAEPPAPAPRAPGVSVRSFAKSEGLDCAHDGARGRFTLTGRGHRVLLFAGTSVASVDGRRVPGLGTIVAGVGGDAILRPADAAALRQALRAKAPEPVARAAAPRAVVPAGPEISVPGVKVPLKRTWRYIVIHHSGTSEGSAAAFHKYHREVKGWDGLGYHFVIGNGRGSGDGKVEVGFRWPKQMHGAHAGRPPDGSNTMNETGIGICLVGDFNRGPPSAAQKRSLHELVDFLSAWCRIPKENIVLHRDIRDTDCPGRRFPAAEFTGKSVRAARP